MITVGQVRRLALSLPRTTEHLIRDRVKFRVGAIVYAAFSRDETEFGFAFPKEERPGLVASAPGTFHLPGESELRFNWVEAWTGALDEDEMRELVVEAWRMVVPKFLAAEHLDGR
ncbi:MmcQ/YjbR family DNA-binding protein [Actinomadura xylanilytica]|uniref:MmcQ/YjbR family DNA-binding protein n=1 Tax=Actinomadura xylanilytica TaxID=887459 RepID=UPI00255AC887|nr:MmcQ/YjbR family DNA-binding protein [Actinomadura xylanilytica]MDL4772161.1 MmcQ/YjbR family DNA-binding protein [Actinomadura xylanilytica]